MHKNEENVKCGEWHAESIKLQKEKRTHKRVDVITFKQTSKIVSGFEPWHSCRKKNTQTSVMSPRQLSVLGILKIQESKCPA